MEPRAEWALEDFQGAEVKLRLLGEASLGERWVAHQGETLRGALEVQLPGSERPSELVRRWRQFGKELSVEVELTAEDEAAADNTEEPSLTRDYEGRENDHDAAVLMRRNCLVRLVGEPEGTCGDAPQSPKGASSSSSSSQESPSCLAYLLEVQVQVPVEQLGRPLMLRAMISPAAVRERDAAERPATSVVPGGGSSSGSGGSSSGGGGSSSSTSSSSSNTPGESNFTERLHWLFELSRVAPVRLPAKRVSLPVVVEQPIFVGSRVSYSADGGGRMCVAIEVENAHRSKTLFVHDLDVLLGASVRSGDGGYGAAYSAAAAARRRGRVDIGASAPLEGLHDAVPSAAASELVDLRGHYLVLWVGKGEKPVAIGSGGSHSFVLTLSPDPGARASARHAAGALETPVTVAWQLADETASVLGPFEAGSLCTSVCAVQWRREGPVKPELLLRLCSAPEARLGLPLQVEIAVRNTTPDCVDLTVRLRPMDAENEDENNAQEGAAALLASLHSRRHHLHSKEDNRRDALAASDVGNPAALLPLDSSVPLGRIQPGANAHGRLQLLPTRAGVARLKGLSLYDAVTGAFYHQEATFEILVQDM